MPNTRQRVLALVREEPQLNQSEIAARVGATRQRVSAILASEGLTVPKGKRGALPRGKAVVTETAPKHAPGLPSYLAAAGGVAGVLVAAADLMTRGYAVYLPVSPSAAPDLIAIDRKGGVKRVGVQRARRRTGNALEYEYPKPNEIDVQAMLVTDEPVHYDPAL